MLTTCNPKPSIWVTGTWGFTVAWFVAMFEGLRTWQRACSTWFALFGNSQGVVEGQHFSAQNGPNCFLLCSSIKNAHFKEFWILILQYNNSLRAPWKRCVKIEPKSKLDITISHDLSWTLHVVEVVNKANKVLCLIKRTIGSVNKEIFSTLYKALVRPILEYASPVWCPYLVKNIVLLEKVQRRASRLALGQRRGEMSYEDRCEMLRWSQLTDRRLLFFFDWML